MKKGSTELIMYQVYRSGRKLNSFDVTNPFVIYYEILLELGHISPFFRQFFCFGKNKLRTRNAESFVKGGLITSQQEITRNEKK